MRSRGWLGRWLPVVAWAALIAGFSSRWFDGERTGGLVLPVLALLFPAATPADLDGMHHILRKLAHFAEYLVLSLLLHRALARARPWSLRPAAVAVVVAGLYAVTDELHQSFVPGRTGAASDCLIDLSGATAGQLLLALRSAGRLPTAERAP